MNWRQRHLQIIQNHPLLVVAICLIITLLPSINLGSIHFDSNYRSYFSVSNPQLQDFTQVENAFSKRDDIIIAVEPKFGTVYQREVLSAIQSLSEAAWYLPYVIRVDSITNHQHTYADADDIITTDLVEKPAYELTSEEIVQIREIVADEPLLKGKLISDDERITGIIVRVSLPESNDAAVTETKNATEKLIGKLRADYPNLVFRASGIVYLNDAFISASLEDTVYLIPLAFLFLIIMTTMILHSVLLTSYIFLVYALSIMFTIGVAVYSGIKVSPATATSPLIILCLAVAHCIHLIMPYMLAKFNGKAQIDALQETLDINYQPMFLTTLSTVIGFLSLLSSESPPFQELGLIVSLGISTAFILSMTLLPALIMILDAKHTKVANTSMNIIVHFERIVFRHYRSLALILSIVTLFCALMMSKLFYDDRFVQYFDESQEFRSASEYLIKNYTGIYEVDIAINAQGESGINEPIYLQKLDEFSQWLKQQPEVTHVNSIVSIYKRMNKNIHQDNPNWYQLPEDRELAAQLLLLYEMGLPYGRNMNDRINVNKSASLVTITLNDLASREIRIFKNHVEQWLKENTPNYMHASVTGSPIMFAYISNRNIDAMIKGGIFSIIIITLLIAYSLNSLKYGLVSLIPNIVPLVIGYGIWAIFIGEINLAGAIAATVSFGLIIDDSVHMLTKYVRAHGELGQDVEEALAYTFKTVGSALIISSVILVMGFFIISQSVFQITAFLGALTTIIIFSALVADFILLPSLLLIFERNNNQAASTQASLKCEQP